MDTVWSHSEDIGYVWKIGLNVFWYEIKFIRIKSNQIEPEVLIVGNYEQAQYTY